jgi:hypothetical protein
MDQGGEFEIVKCGNIKAQLLSDQTTDHGGSCSMPGLPGEGAIEFFGYLTDQDAFDVTTGGFRKPKTVNLLEESLDCYHRRINLF